ASIDPREREAYASTLGLEIRSGTRGAGSSVEFVCPGGPLDPRPFTPRVDPPRSCPHKYVVDGSSGLGVSRRWAGYSEARGNDRLRLARVLARVSPTLRAPRLEAIESALWLGALVLLALFGPRTRRDAGQPSDAGGVARISLALTGALAFVVAHLNSPPTSFVEARGGTATVALLLLALGARHGSDGIRIGAGIGVWAIALIALSPLAGHGDLLMLLDRLRETLVLGLDLSWATAGTVAAVACGLPLIVALLALGRSLRPGPAASTDQARERRHTRLAMALALAAATFLALRKPGDDLALLQGAAAVFAAGSFFGAGGLGTSRRAILALSAAAIAALPWLGPLLQRTPGGDLVATATQSALVLLALLVASADRRWLSSRPTEGADRAPPTAR
ncbi:MAG: hypothetical protein KC457_21465, partial [Myxococcales bacterium]|nr:hypothetical protein [Myxococcales bacterium]